MSIKMKILIPMIILTILVAASILASDIIQFSNSIDSSMYANLDTASLVALNEIEMFKKEAHSASLIFADDSELKEAIESGDLDTLQSRAAKIYSDTDITYCMIADTSGIALARPHAPKTIGDDVNAMACVRSALSGNTFTTIEADITVLISACSGSPIYNEQGELIGVVVTGFRLGTTEYVDSLKKMLNCEVTVFLGDERVATTVVKEDGTRAVGTKAAENVSKQVLAGNTYSGSAKVVGRDALTKYNPIMDADGKAKGMLFVGYYQDEKTAVIVSFVKFGLIITLILLAICVPIILFIARLITVPIKTMVQAAHSLAEGDTGISVQTKAKDETGELANAFNDMIENTQQQIKTIELLAAGDLSVEITKRSEKDTMNIALIKMIANLNQMFLEIHTATEQVFSGSTQLADNAQSLAQGSAEQSAAVEQLSNSITDIEGKTKTNADMAGRAASLANTIMSNAEKGSRQMNEMMTAVKEINEASQRINKVIKVIDDIAFQTNILALNAAVEAARAGQHGKGFAVVAEEVRNLAAKSADAAKDTGGLITSSMEKAELGARIAGNTSASLAEIVSGINESTQLVSEIAKLSEEQAISISQLNHGIDQVANVIQQNYAAAEESSAASEEMNGQASMLEGLVAQFKLKDSRQAQVGSASPTRRQLNMPKITTHSTSSNGEYGKY